MAVQLTKLERKILTVAEMSCVGDRFNVGTAKWLGIPIATVTRTLAKLTDAGLVDTIELAQDDEPSHAVYSHTAKVTREMLDEETHYHFGGRPRSTYPIEDRQQ